MLDLGRGCVLIGGSLEIAAGARISILTAGTETSIVARGSIVNNGDANVDPANVSVQGGINNAKGQTLSLGNGQIVVGGAITNGSGKLSFGRGPFYINGGTITNGTGILSLDDGPFSLWGGGISNSSTGRMTFGNGPFYFYGGTVTNVAGTMESGSGPFQFKGGSLSLNSGSETSFGVGDMNFYGGTGYFLGRSVTLGAGGDGAKGASTMFFSGGTFSFNGGKLNAEGTTFAFDGGTHNFYGPGKVVATAPTDNSPANGYGDILLAVYGGALNFHQSTAVTNIMSGVIYVPATNASIYGSQTIRRPGRGCLEIVAGVVDIYRNADLDLRPCVKSSGSVGLVR